MKSASMTVRQKRTNRIAWLILAPFIIYYTVFSVLPLIGTFFISFTGWTGVGYNFGSLSFDNYVQIFRDPDYFRILLNTFLLGAVILVLNFGLGFLLGYLFSKPTKIAAFFRTVWYFPVVVSMAVISLIFNTMLNPVNGSLNVLIELMGGEPVMWQQSTFWMFFWIIFLVVWKGLGGVIILFVAGFSSISKEMLEAADLDGATGYKRMWYIVIPSMKNLMIYVIITSLMGIFSIFEPVMFISGGGPRGTTNVIMFQIYNEAFQNFNMGMSSALSVLVMILTMGLSFANMKMLNISL